MWGLIRAWAASTDERVKEGWRVVVAMSLGRAREVDDLETF